MASMPLANMMEGMAKMTMKEVTTIAQTKIGIRLSDMPTAFCLNTVVMISTAVTRPEISVSVIIWDQKSARLPGEYSGPESGTYANQPASAPILSTKPV